MATDPTDKLLVASVLERGKRDIDDDMRRARARGRPGARAFDTAAELGVDVPSRRARSSPGRSRPPSSRRTTRTSPHAGRARCHRRGHGRHRRPGPDVPQGDRQGAAPQRRGGGRPRQGDRARRADRRRALEGRPVALGVDPERHRAQEPQQATRAPADHYAAETDRIVRGAFAAADEDGLLVAGPGLQADRGTARGHDRSTPRRSSRRPSGSWPATSEAPDAASFATPRRLLLHGRPQRRPGGARQHGPARALRLEPGPSPSRRCAA